MFVSIEAYLSVAVCLYPPLSAEFNFRTFWMLNLRPNIHRDFEQSLGERDSK